MNLVERDAALTTDRTFRVAAEVGIQEVTSRMSAHPTKKAGTGQPVPEQSYRNQIALSLLLSSQNSMRVPQFDEHGQLRLWSSTIS